MIWYEFDSFQFEVAKRILRKEGQPVELPLQAAELLLVFLRDPKEVFSKGELLKKAWPDKFVAEGSLTYQIYVIRKALGTRPSGEEYIETEWRRGYRFTAPVCEHHPEKIEAQTPSPSTVHSAIPETPLSGPYAVKAQPSKAARSSVRSWAIYGISALAIVMAFFLMALLKPYLAVSSRISVASYDRLTNDGQEKINSYLLTDGKEVYFMEKQPNGDTFTSVAVGGGETGHISLPPGFDRIYDLDPTTSELLAGRLAADQLGPKLWSVPLLGPPPRPIGDLRANSASRSPDKQKIAFTLGHDLYVANADGSGSREIAAFSGGPSLPRWSHDGKILRFTEGLAKDGDNFQAIWEVGADGSNLHRLLSGWNHPPRECCGDWTPDGKFFVFQSEQNGRNDLWAIPEHRGLFGTKSESPVKLSSDAAEFQFPTISANGKQVFAIGTSERGELVGYDSRLKKFVPFLDGIPATWVCFSKSGRFVAYINYSDKTVWRANADGSHKTKITFPPFEAEGLAWSPDEKTLALWGQKPGKPWSVYSVPSAGGDVLPLLPRVSVQGIPTWSADGKRIAFGDIPPVYNKALGWEAIHILELSSHALTELPNSRGLWTARWSPDGRFLAALTVVGQQLKLYDFKTGTWRSTEAEAVNNPTWSSDSKYIYFDRTMHDHALLRLRVADGQVELLTSLKAYPRLAPGWSGVAPDNSPLVLHNRGDSEIYSLALEYR